jgi:hypothetical protein
VEVRAELWRQPAWLLIQALPLTKHVTLHKVLKPSVFLVWNWNTKSIHRVIVRSKKVNARRTPCTEELLLLVMPAFLSLVFYYCCTEGTLWHLQKFLHHSWIHPSIILLYSPSPYSWNVFIILIIIIITTEFKSTIFYWVHTVKGPHSKYLYNVKYFDWKTKAHLWLNQTEEKTDEKMYRNCLERARVVWDQKQRWQTRLPKGYHQAVAGIARARHSSWHCHWDKWASAVLDSW